jgi:type IV pilus assembly protein PilC
MEYTYTAYTKDKKLVKGKLTAASEEAATSVLNYGGYQLVSLKANSGSVKLGKINLQLGSSVKSKEILMFARQLALLLESGTDLVNAIELLQKQTTNKTFFNILHDLVNDIHNGSSFSTALGNHPKVFPNMFIHAMAAGEQAGNLDVVLRQTADYIERDVITKKKLRSALTYPIVIFVLAIVVVAVLAMFVFPTFVSLFAQFGANLPTITKVLIAVAAWSSKYAIYVIGILLVAIIVVYSYVRTSKGRFKLDEIMLRVPIIGRIIVLNELSRTCRTMSLLFKVGLPLPEILGLAIRSAENGYYSAALKEVQQDLIRGEGLSRPMEKHKVFLPLMVQMVSVGEETGNLDNALTTVAVSYETEADDRTAAAVGMIQPILTIGIAVVVGFVAVAMISTMYGIYGQINV